MTRTRRRFVAMGLVQGVGFRPFVHRLAHDLGLAGTVANRTGSVVIEVEGTPPAIAEFALQLRADAPRLAQIDALTVTELASTGDEGFRIVASDGGDTRAPRLIPADVATCDACHRELLDPTDRRHRHPFISCTDCGPRFTIVTAFPFDRATTTMASFPLCAACQREYDDPANRRHHAQTLACPDCGPVLAHRGGTTLTTGNEAALRLTRRDLDAGRIVAVKGLGGYHLAVNARDEPAVARLRARKRRGEKPLAVMVPDLEAARRIAVVDDAAAVALASPERPIVLVEARPGRGVAPSVAPSNPWLGVLLPYTPLHHLLFAPATHAPDGSDDASGPPDVLVMTSGNVADEPICTDDDTAAARLGTIADSFLVHDRPIATPCDDSVVRLIGRDPVPVRRSRGAAPLPVRLPFEVAPTLAVGGELKNTFALAAGRRAWLSPHLGDMHHAETLAAFEPAVARLGEALGIVPQVVAVDAHPGYHTTAWARAHADAAAVVEVQHHHAHLASLLAEHGVAPGRPVIGVVFDGAGHGTDGASWGGEILVGNYAGAERWGHLAPVTIPGGDSAARNPCRTALAHLQAAGVAWADDLAPVAATDQLERRVLQRQLVTGTNCATTTSMGRLFDAVASLLGLRHRVDHEAQAAVALEALASRATHAVTLPLPVDPATGALDGRPLVRRVVGAKREGVDPAALALGFHEAVAGAVTAAAVGVRAERGVDVVGLTGGVHQNALLTTATSGALEREGFTVLTHRVVPPNDGGIALGQAMVAACGGSVRPRAEPTERRAAACV